MQAVCKLKKKKAVPMLTLLFCLHCGAGHVEGIMFSVMVTFFYAATYLPIQYFSLEDTEAKIRFFGIFWFV